MSQSLRYETHRRVSNILMTDTFVYPVNDAARRSGVLTTQPVTVRWPSGASVTMPAITANLSAGYAQQFTFTRSAGVPGAELDYQASAEFEARIATQQSQLGFDLGRILGQAIAK